MARRRRRRSRPRRAITRYVKRTRRRAHARGSYTTNKQKGQLAIGSAAAGYLVNNVAGVSAQIEKLPKLGNFTFTAGVAGAIANKFIKNKWLDIMATGALMAGAYEFGKAKFSLEGGSLEGGGWDDAMTEDEVSGVVEGDEEGDE